MSCRTPRYDWTLVQLTIALVIVAAVWVAVLAASVRGEDYLAPIPDGLYQPAGDVSGETVAEIERQEAILKESQYCQPRQPAYPIRGYPQVQYAQGPQGLQGPPGPPGTVDYRAVNAEIAKQVRDAENVLRTDLQQVLEQIENESEGGDAALHEQINAGMEVVDGIVGVVATLQGRVDVLAQGQPNSSGDHQVNPVQPSPASQLPLETLIAWGLTAAGVSSVGAAPIVAGFALRGVWRWYRRRPVTQVQQPVPTQHTAQQPPAPGVSPAEPFCQASGDRSSGAVSGQPLHAGSTAASDSSPQGDPVRGGAG